MQLNVFENCLAVRVWRNKWCMGALTIMGECTHVTNCRVEFSREIILSWKVICVAISTIVEQFEINTCHQTFNSFSSIQEFTHEQQSQWVSQLTPVPSCNVWNLIANEWHSPVADLKLTAILTFIHAIEKMTSKSNSHTSQVYPIFNSGDLWMIFCS